jgi:adenylate cyclase
VLEGSVRKAGNRVRITAQLIDGQTGDHVWADRYDRDLTDIFEIQDELSRAIVEALKLKLLPEEKKAIESRGTTDAGAYNLYLMAKKYWVNGNWGDTRQLELVIRVCQRALDLDPNYARAWGLLAIVQCVLHFTFAGPGDGGIAAADRALSIDSSVAEAYCVRARHFYERGRFADCDKELARALELDPESWEVNRETGRIYYFERRFDEAVRRFEKAVSIDETDFNSWSLLASAYGALDDSAGLRRAAKMAAKHAEDAVADDPTNGAAVAALVFGFAVSGERERAKEWIERALLICPDNQIMRYNFACQTAKNLNDPEAAIDLLEPILPDFSISALKAFVADPDFDSLRENPRFVQLMDDARMRLQEAAATPPGAS